MPFHTHVIHPANFCHNTKRKNSSGSCAAMPNFPIATATLVISGLYLTARASTGRSSGNR
jgi:hypothetical protein